MDNVVTRWSVLVNMAILYADTGLPYLKAYSTLFTTTVLVLVKSNRSSSNFFASPVKSFSSMMHLVRFLPLGYVKAIIFGKWKVSWQRAIVLS